MECVGILGGTFDPVHNGHLRAAMEMRDALGLAQVRLIPCARPPHRESPVLSARQRMQLLHQAIDGQPGLMADDRELSMDGPSYSVNTLHSLRVDLPGKALCLAIGADALFGFHTWHRWREILDLAHLVILGRPGWVLDDNLSALDAQVRDELARRRVNDGRMLAQSEGGKVFFLAIPALDIAASSVRALLAQGRSPRWLVPDNVLDDIIRLYTNQSS